MPNTESNDPSDQLQDPTRHAILTVDREGRILACSDAASRTLAASEYELLGTLVLDWFVPEERKAVERALRRVFEGEAKAVGARATVLRADGVRCTLPLRVLPLPEGAQPNAANVVIGATASGRGIRQDKLGRSVLVVDDDEALRGVIRRMLSKVGYDVTEASSGRSALDQITSLHPPAFILTDLGMPHGSGYWLLDRLARDFPVLLRRTVIVTGESSAAVKRVARETGCPVVRKPFELQELLTALDQAVARN